MLSYSAVPYRAGALTFLCCTAVLAGCAKSKDRVAEEGAARDTVAAAPATRVATATISLADVAGKWKMRVMDESGGNVVESELVATTDSTWTFVAQGRKPIQEHVVAIAGDSIVTEAGPYESFIRKGVQVRTRVVYRLQNGKLVGTMEARYATKGGDSVSRRRSEGTRVQ